VSKKRSIPSLRDDSQTTSTIAVTVDKYVQRFCWRVKLLEGKVGQFLGRVVFPGGSPAPPLMVVLKKLLCGTQGLYPYS